MKFWELRYRSGRDLAEWADEMRFATRICPLNPDHRLAPWPTELKIVLPRQQVGDFVSTWMSDLLVQERTLELLREEGITGFEVRPAQARFKRPVWGTPPPLWQIVVTGFAGMAAPESGCHPVGEVCPACGWQNYKTPSNMPDMLDERAWDGSDLFIVWPYPRFIFASDRLKRLVERLKLTGLKFEPLSTLAVDPANPIQPPEIVHPGPLSLYFPQQRARELSEKFNLP